MQHKVCILPHSRGRLSAFIITWLQHPSHEGQASSEFRKTQANETTPWHSRTV